jgi:NifU-like protein involved in Fe-S cluster formation
VHLAAGIEGDTVRELRFQALGCPHLIAAAELFCSRFEGRAVATLGDFRPRDLMRELTVPLDKTGRILLLEDAIQLLRQEFSNTTPI